MQFWLVHSSDVPVRDQIVQQVSLGVLTGEIAAGERLPSIRELARRFSIHPNTISAAYRELRVQGWVTQRRGSGVYASLNHPRRRQRQGQVVDDLIQQTVMAARRLSISDDDLKEKLHRALKLRRHLVLIEPDADLARLVEFEIEQATGRRIDVCSSVTDSYMAQLKSRGLEAIPVVLPSKVASVRTAIGESAEMFVLEINPVAGSLAQQLPVSRDHLVAIASHWPRFIEIAQTMLISAGFSADALVCRDARVEDWSAGLAQAAAVVCDSFTATRLPDKTHVITFPLLAKDCLERLSALAEFQPL